MRDRGIAHRTDKPNPHSLVGHRGAQCESLAQRRFTLDAAKTRVVLKIGSRGDIDFFGAKRPCFAFHTGDHVIESLAFGGRQRATADVGGF